ncbi:hypothetical protein [Paenibacillus popilliae]|nr:hypothetical protein [Paenibacillus popilliae]
MRMDAFGGTSGQQQQGRRPEARCPVVIAVYHPRPSLWLTTMYTL